MPRRPPDPDQSRLFDDSPTARAMEVVAPADHDAPVRALAASVDPRVRLGTSSWSFPGWVGPTMVYRRRHTEAELARHGLAAYATHPLLRTVGLDRAFYRPLSVEEFAALGAQTPDGFSFVIKAHQPLTRPDADELGRTFGDTGSLRESGSANPRFLDAQYAIDRVIGPAAVGLGAKAGPIVFQFPPLDLAQRGRLGGPAALIDRIGGFLSRLPRAGSDRWGGPRYVIELRNREMLLPAHIDRYAQMLRAAGASHGWVSHPAMPPLAHQAASFAAAGYGPAEQPLLCLRWLLIHTETYDGAKDRYAPFTRLVDEDPASRDQVTTLIRSTLSAGRNAWVIANNKAEGSAPLTIVRIAEQLAREFGTERPASEL